MHVDKKIINKCRDNSTSLVYILPVRNTLVKCQLPLCNPLGTGHQHETFSLKIIFALEGTYFFVWEPFTDFGGR